MTTTSAATSTTIDFLIPLIIFMVLALITFILHFIKYYRYNPSEGYDIFVCCKPLFYFFVIAIKHFSIGLWLYCICLAGYVFCFFKFQQTVYLMLPDTSADWGSFYELFMIIFYIQVGLVLAVCIGTVVDLSQNTDYFLIDWEKDKQLSNF